MIQKIITISILSLVLTGCMSESISTLATKPVSLTQKEEPTDEFIPRSINLVALGDSLTKGVGDGSDQGGYVGRITEMLEGEKGIKEVQVKNFGMKGHKTTNLEKRLKEEEVIQSLQQADMIVMTIGGNDIMNVVRQNIFSLDFEPFRAEQLNFERRLTDIFGMIRDYNSDALIVFVGLYNPFKFMLPNLTEIDQIIEEWNNGSKQIITNDKYGVFVPVEDIFSSQMDQKLLYKDEFHPNERGYTLMADRIYQVLTGEDITMKFSGRNE
ncbi:GDSL family lipase [Bacillus sp. UMB0899]|uniref:SGNH/GDSL hydrolase family protein n=1 Tax=Metabacillus schmidteae TaxID=2730405 RepID=UPI000C7FFEC2|nr:SGNH/GDSL hydrolase family protein [Metabacillus schmidteae]PMC39240.1 GDSL family lipase [Bacillus sp. UMB0899]